MTDQTNYDDEPVEPEIDRVHALLQDPSMWAEPSPGLEDDIVALITTESRGQRLHDSAAPTILPTEQPGPQTELQSDGSVAPVTDLASRRPRPWILAGLASAAAAAVIVVASFALLANGSTSEAVEVAMAGTDEAPGASAIASVEDRPNGSRIILDVSDLPPAPEGSFYAAWLIRDGDPTTRVGAGTFHQRGGDGSLELWAGVSTTTYQTISVTRQTVDDPSGPGVVVLRGQRSG